MTCILLDIDGVLHVSGEAIPGAPEAVGKLRADGHTLRFVTNNSTRPRDTLAEELREIGFELDETEIQTTSRAAVRALGGRRVLALVMASIVPDLEGLELVGHDAEAVLIGGCDETLEPNQVFSYMNLARAFSEIQGGGASPPHRCAQRTSRLPRQEPASHWCPAGAAAARQRPETGPL